MESSRARKPEEQSSTLCHRKCSHNMKPEVSTTVGGAGKSSDGLHRIHWKQIDSDGISGSLVGHMMKPEVSTTIRGRLESRPMDSIGSIGREHEPIQARYTRNVIARS